MKKIAALLLAVVLVMATAVPALAAGFTPSVEAKPAPTVVPQTGSDGEEYEAIIYDESKKQVIGVPDGALIVTPKSEAEAAQTDIKQKLDTAYEQIQAVNSLAELSSDLEAAAKEVSPDLTVDDLVVRDMFDVSVMGTYADYLAVEGNSLAIRFDLSTDAQSLVAVLFSEDGKTWKTIPSSDIERYGNFSVSIVLYSKGVLAFVFDVGELPVDPNGPDAPQTGDPTWSIVGWAAAGGVAILTAAGVAGKKKSFRKYDV